MEALLGAVVRAIISGLHSPLLLLVVAGADASTIAREDDR